MNLKTFILPAISISCAVGTLVSCVNSDKDLFNKEQAKELYEETFPVSGIDPNTDWKTTNNVSVIVSVNEDAGVNYRIRVYDSYPFAEDQSASLLVEGVASNNLKFITSFDAPKALEAVYVVRTDENNRHLLKYASIENGKINASFGSVQVNTRATRSDVEIETISTPYTNDELNSMLSGATEVQPNWDFSENSIWNQYAGYDVFQTPTGVMRYFKVTKPYEFNGNSNNGGPVTLLITSKATLNSSWNFGGKVECIITDGGELELNGSVDSWGSMKFTVLQGGKITGTGSLKLANGSEGATNYNAGIIEIDKLTVTAGNAIFYNCGTVNVNHLDFTNVGRYINQGKTKIDKSTVNIAIENACYFEANDLHFTTIKCGSLSAIKTNNLSSTNGSRTITMAANSMITANGDVFMEQSNYNGPSTGYALVKINNLTNANIFASTGNIYYEFSDFTYINSNIENSYFKQFLDALKNTEGSFSQWGESPIIIPAGECCGEGNNQNESGEDIPDNNPMSFTYAYEDNFPQPGDYDFNDIAMNVSTTYTKDSENKIQKIHYHVSLAAVGATKKLGAGLRLAGISKGSVTNVEFVDNDNMRSTLANSVFENSTMESNDNSIVIPLFGDAHAIYGAAASRIMLNTGLNTTSKISTLEVIITLADQNQTTPIITKDNLDFFIAYSIGSTGNRTEVHLYEFLSNGATARGDIHTQNLEAAGNKTWAICVPKFNYPTEMTSIVEAYPQFTQWAQNHTSSLDWYLHPTDKGGKIYKVFE